MVRTNIGISKFPVSDEIDPGFGADTEQRRVEFAAKLEEEAFSISIGDATKIAKANMISALKLWGRPKLSVLLHQLSLREIMIIWIFFEISFVINVWLKTIDNKGKKLILKDEKTLGKYIDALFTPLLENIPEKVKNIPLDLTEIVKIREDYGGDLLFSLKSKNDLELRKIYSMTYSKLPKSLRDKMYLLIVGFEISYSKLSVYLSYNYKSIKRKVMKELHKMYNEAEELSRDNYSSVVKIVEAFDEEMKNFLNEFGIHITPKGNEVKKKIKEFYGID
jgi:hypothetical protein